MTKDLHIYESGSGGDLALQNNDLLLSETLYQSIYLSLFGGNIEASTTGQEIAEEERFDYWANSLIFKNKASKQFNSETERVLREVTINSSGRLKIKTAVENDLSFIKSFASVEVFVNLLSTDKIEIKINVKQNSKDASIQFLWDNAKNEVIIEQVI